MIAPIRDLENKFSFTTLNTFLILTFELPTVSFTSNTRMDLFSGPPSDNYNKVKGRSLLTNDNISRDSSMSFMRSSIAYYERMDCNNAIVINNDMNNNSPVLSYENEQKKVLRVSKAAKQQNNMRYQGDILQTFKPTS